MPSTAKTNEFLIDHLLMSRLSRSSKSERGRDERKKERRRPVYRNVARGRKGRKRERGRGGQRLGLGSRVEHEKRKRKSSVADG